MRHGESQELLAHDWHSQLYHNILLPHLFLLLQGDDSTVFTILSSTLNTDVLALPLLFKSWFLPGVTCCMAVTFCLCMATDDGFGDILLSKFWARKDLVNRQEADREIQHGQGHYKLLAHVIIRASFFLAPRLGMLQAPLLVICVRQWQKLPACLPGTDF